MKQDNTRELFNKEKAREIIKEDKEIEVADLDFDEELEILNGIYVED